MLKEKIADNRFRHERYGKAERLLRRLRVRIFDYEDAGNGDKASRLMQRCQERLAPFHRARRAALEAARLERTPSAFEPGLCG